MPRIAAAIPMTGVELDRDGEIPLTRQLYDRLRGSILSGQLGGGFHLPATRSLAADLGVSRNTVLRAYEQLQTEGYIEVRAGSGATVTRVLPDTLLQARVRPSGIQLARVPPPVGPGPSRRGAMLAAGPTVAIGGARPGG